MRRAASQGGVGQGAGIRPNVIPLRHWLPYCRAMTRYILTAVLLCCALLAPQARAAGEPDLARIVHAEVLPGWRMSDGHRMAALQLTLAPGWHTYWRAPGEAGIPPSFDWSGSENLKAVAIHWPVPEIFDLGGMRSIGYTDTLVLPVELTPKQADRPIVLRAKVDLGVCDQVCLPATLTLAADLDGPGTRPAAITRALARGPQSASQAGLTAASCTVEPITDGLRLTAHLTLPPLGGKEVTVFELPDASTFISGATTTRDGRNLTAVADVMPARQPFLLDRGALTITVLGKGRAVELHGCPAG